MPRYKITQHLSGWKIVENFVDAKNEEEANELYNKGDENLNLLEWREVDEEYRINDTEIEIEGDTPTEGVKKWREQNEKI
jgi:hypothetical protein